MLERAKGDLGRDLAPCGRLGEDPRRAEEAKGLARIPGREGRELAHGLGRDPIARARSGAFDDRPDLFDPMGDEVALVGESGCPRPS